MLQNLPSLVAAYVLAPAPGSRVLDMCAAPGGKATALAQLMGDRGEVVAFDRSHSRAGDVRRLAEEFGLASVRSYKMDATKAIAMRAVGTKAIGTKAVGSQPVAASSGTPENGTAPQQERQQPAEQQQQQQQAGEQRRQQSDKQQRQQQSDKQQRQQQSDKQQRQQQSDKQQRQQQSDQQQRQPAGGAVLNPRVAQEQQEQQQPAEGAAPNPRVAARLSRIEAARAARGQPPPHSARTSKVAMAAPREATLAGPLPPESFDHVLLDAPCTALGLRPRLRHVQTIGELQGTAQYQRKLLEVAVAALRPGGNLIFSTCTINPGGRWAAADGLLREHPLHSVMCGLAVGPGVGLVCTSSSSCRSIVRQRSLHRPPPRLWPPAAPHAAAPTHSHPPSQTHPTTPCKRHHPAAHLAAGENEANVRWLLDRYPCLRLVPQTPHLGGPGLTGRVVPPAGCGPPQALLSPAEAALVQRFDPDSELDTIGFFIAKLEKLGSVL